MDIYSLFQYKIDFKIRLGEVLTANTAEEGRTHLNHLLG
jgi:hypothetical protein